MWLFGEESLKGQDTVVQNPWKLPDRAVLLGIHLIILWMQLNNQAKLQYVLIVNFWLQKIICVHIQTVTLQNKEYRKQCLMSQWLYNFLYSHVVSEVEFRWLPVTDTTTIL